MTDDQDETIERIAAALRPLPVVDPEARARLLVAVAAERERARASGAEVDAEGGARGGRRLARWAGGALLAASLAGAAFLLGRVRAEHDVASGARARVVADGGVPALGASPAQLVARPGDAAEGAQPVQLVFRAPGARRVSVVGDFTGWEAGRVVMQRDAASGLWSASLSLAPGRHVYAFLVDDTLWQRDPRAAAAPDADFGRPGSVLLVGRP